MARDTPSTLVAAPALPAAHDPRYAEGVGLVLLATLLWSISGLLVRSIESTGSWQLVVYRSASMVVSLLVIIALRHRGRVVAAFRAVGWLGVLGGVCFAVSSICYLFSVLNTTVANTAFLYATTPFFAAILAWLVMRERVRPTTWLALAVAITGTGLMVLEGVEAGHWLGNLFGLLSAVGFGAQMVVVRFGRHLDMMPSMCLGGVLATVAGLVMAADVAIAPHDLGICFLMGSVQLAVPLALFTLGSRFVPVVQLSLLALLDPVFNPLWAWLGVGEVPGSLTLLGGAVVLLAVGADALWAARPLRTVAA